MAKPDQDNVSEYDYLTSNPNNKKHLDKSIQQAKEGKLTKVDPNDL
ncbi:hypothetical protein [Lentilactobacillus otakiensis]